MKRPILILALCLLLSACHSVDMSKMRIPQASVNSCTYIYVNDQRPYILSGDKTRDFLGLVRGGYGNPFDFSTSSGSSLAKELGISLQQSLRSSNGAVTFIDSQNVATQNQSGCKTLVLKFTEWKIDAMIDAWFMVDAELSVYSQNGQTLASQQKTAKYAVDGSFFSPLPAARANFLKESENTIAALLSHPEINAALSR